MPRKRTWLRLRKHLIGWAFISPWTIGFLGLTLLPFVMSFYYSFTWYQLGRPVQFTGLENFRTMFTNDPKFMASMRVTFQYTFVVVPLTVIQGVIIALLLNQNVRGVAFFRTAFYIPGMVSGVGWMLLWGFLLAKDGAINGALSLIGVEGPSYLRSVTWALPSLALMELFVVGSSMLVTLAALQGVPEQLYDAAKIDGAGNWAQLWHVTLPQISPAVFYNVTLSFIGVLQTFAKGFIMTEGGPRFSTLFYGYYLYQSAFRYYRMGYACAMAWFLFVIILLITGLNFLVGKQWVFYEAEQRRP